MKRKISLSVKTGREMEANTFVKMHLNRVSLVRTHSNVFLTSLLQTLLVLRSLTALPPVFMPLRIP